MKKLKRFNRDDKGEPDMLKGIMFSIILASPGTRSLLLKVLMITYLLGAITAVVVFDQAPWLFTWLISLWR